MMRDRCVKNRFEMGLVALVLSVIGWSAWKPADWGVWWMEMSWVLGAFALLLATARWFRFSTASYAIVTIWLVMHTVGAHYTFEHVPFGWVTNLFGFTRNHYDRVAHFAIGLNSFMLAELFYRKRWASTIGFAAFAGVIAIMAMACAWEIIEWLVAVWDGGSDGLAFLGSQGDVWDAQEDMLADTLGAILAAVLFRLRGADMKVGRVNVRGSIAEEGMLKLFKFAMAVVLVLAALVVLSVVVETPAARRFKRYCDYPNKDALLAAESNDVSKVVTCTIDGKDVTIVEMGWMGFLPSGPTMLVYDADGKLIDKTSDEGDDSRFQQKWISPWSLALKEKALRWLRETRLPEAHCAAPNTMADFAAYMEQASKDIGDPDKPVGERGIRFKCCKTAAKVAFPENLKNELPLVICDPAGGVSFWDALTNVCKRTGCTYRIYDRTIDICNCK